MSIEHDPYPDLPPLSLNTRLVFSAIEPEHFELTTEMLEESQAVGRALLAIRAVIESYMTGGDVTPRD
ncbi:hypothetical protein [Mycobacteroides chelonae]|uniref:hypothetical protein n=1 Tax=Mycobacteroides chelonae TaxID=1774 RepID=UPI000994462E|nr:hypothetical protein [Mycobacteroides chelonae]